MDLITISENSNSNSKISSQKSSRDKTKSNKSPRLTDVTDFYTTEDDLTRDLISNDVSSEQFYDRLVNNQYHGLKQSRPKYAFNSAENIYTATSYSQNNSTDVKSPRKNLKSSKDNSNGDKSVSQKSHQDNSNNLKSSSQKTHKDNIKSSSQKSPRNNSKVLSPRSSRVKPSYSSQYPNLFGGGHDDVIPSSGIFVDDVVIKQLNQVISKTNSLMRGGRSSSQKRKTKISNRT